MKMFKVLCQRNFHNVSEKHVRPLATHFDEGLGCLMGRVSSRTLAAIYRHYCGISDCSCGSGPAVVFPYNDRSFWISIVK